MQIHRATKKEESGERKYCWDRRDDHTNLTEESVTEEAADDKGAALTPGQIRSKLEKSKSTKRVLGNASGLLRPKPKREKKKKGQ